MTAGTVRKKSSVDLSQGNIVKGLILFAIPIFVGNLFQNLYNSVDSMVVGNFVGKNALAAVNVCSPITMLLNGFFVGMSTGSSVLFSQCFGARNYEKLKKAIHTTMIVALIIGIGLSLIGLVFHTQLLNIVSCPEDIFEEASGYLCIYIFGLFFTSVYNVEAGMLRSVGDSRNPFYALLIASCINIVLDLVFVGVLGMGVKGVAIATIISQFVSVCFTLNKMMKMDERYAFEFKSLKIDTSLIPEIMRLGLPAGVQMSIVSISNMFVSSYMNSFGSTVTAGVGVANRLDRFVSMPSQAIGLASTTFVSQNVGAGNKERTTQGIKWCFILGFASLLIMCVPMYINSEFFIKLFNSDPEVVSYGVLMMHTMIPLYWLMTIGQVVTGAVRGYGYSLQNMFLGLIGMVGVRQVFLYVTMHFISWKLQFVFYSYPVGWGANALVLAMYYFYLKFAGKLDARVKQVNLEQSEEAEVAEAVEVAEEEGE